MNKSMSGFTIVELLIVIVIIGVLAAISIVAYNGVQTRSQASAFSQTIKQVDKALRLYAVEQGWSQWPNESTLVAGVTEAPQLETMITSTPGFNAYLQRVPTIGGVNSGSWSYDNDSDVLAKEACTLSYNGTNIHIGTMTSQAIAQAIDQQIDDGNISCGMVRYDSAGSRLLYALSYTSNLSN